MSSSNKQSSHVATMRRSIASLAARLMAEDGVSDYGLAKRKAARQLGVSDSEALPGNNEVEEELRVYQSLYQGQEQRERLAHLRKVALRAMELLHPFKTYLTGSVLDGTAGRYSRVSLEVFADDMKAVEIFLLNSGLHYTQESLRHPGRADAPEMVFEFQLEETPVTLAVYDALAERSRPRSARGRGPERAHAQAVRALIEDAA